MKSLYLFISFVFLVPMSVVMYGSSSAAEIEVGIELSDIHYAYSVCEDNNGLDCIGTLSFKVNVPSGVTHLIFRETKPHFTDPRIWFQACWDLPFEPSQSVVEFEQEGVYWGTYFRLTCYMEDGTCLWSPLYHTDSYVSSTDLERLTSSGIVESAVNDVVAPKYSADTRTLEMGDDAYLEVYDSAGRTLFSGYVSGSYSFGYRTEGLIIIRCIKNQQIFTQKIIL